MALHSGAADPQNIGAGLLTIQMAAAKLYLAAHLGDHLGERHRSFQDVFRLRLEGTVHGGTVGKRLAPNALPRAHVVPRPDDATFEVGSAADPRSR